MFERILVAVDGSETAQHGFTIAVAFARERKAVLDVLFVVDETPMLQGLSMASYVPPDVFDGLDASLRETGAKVLAACETQAARDGLQVHPIIEVTVGEPVSSVILRVAVRQRSELIVLGTHGRRGLVRLTMGSDAEAVVRSAPVPVLLVRHPTLAQPEPKATNAS